MSMKTFTRSGMTLIEVLAAATILAAMMLGLFGWMQMHATLTKTQGAWTETALALGQIEGVLRRDLFNKTGEVSVQADSGVLTLSTFLVEKTSAPRLAMVQWGFVKGRVVRAFRYMDQQDVTQSVLSAQFRVFRFEKTKEGLFLVFQGTAEGALEERLKLGAGKE